MKYANAETAALLQSARQVFMVELYTLTLVGGEVFLDSLRNRQRT